MKRLYISSMALLAFALGAFAIPADPEPKLVTQPDGSELYVRIIGDEYSHIVCTSDGYPLFYNRNTGAFEYAIQDDGSLGSSGVIAKEKQERGEKENSLLASMDSESILADVMATKARPLRSPERSDFLISNYPTLGRCKTLVVLVEFSDVKFSSMDDPLSFYNDMMNKEGFSWSNGAEGSCRDFYLASSAGLFDPDFVVKGPVELSHEATYYGKDNPSQDSKMGEFLKEALLAVAPQVDFSEFDLDNDGIIDNVYFFYAGGGQADDPQGSDYIWPHSAFASEWKVDLALDGKQFGHYACSNELRWNRTGELIPTGIGTFVHEFGHVLGLVDHYDVSYGLISYHPGTWDTMASGAYNNNMNTPPLFSGFERAELGWLEYLPLPSDWPEIVEMKSLAESNQAWRIDVPDSPDEYFVLENRQKQGWDSHLPGHGMLVWHLDQDKNIWDTNIVNIDPYHQRVDIVEADGRIGSTNYDGDAFPGSENIRSFSLKNWNGDEVAAFDYVSEADNIVKLLLADTSFTLPAPAEINCISSDESSFTFRWSEVDNACHYIVSVSDDQTGLPVEGFDTVSYDIPENVTVEGLEAEHSFTVSVKAGIGGYLSEAAVLTLTTSEMPFVRRKVENVRATEISDTGFKALWDVLDSADDYELNVVRLVWNEESAQSGYDFTDKEKGLPASWYSTSSIYYSVNGFYGAEAPSLRFSADGDYLEIGWPETLIDNVSFWIRAKEKGQSLRLQYEDAQGDWNDISEVEVPVEETVLNLNVGGYPQIRLLVSRSSGFVVIDDVVAEVRRRDRIPVDGFTGLLSGNVNEFLLQGLQADTAYGLTVTGLMGSQRSVMSEECVVRLPESAKVQIMEESKDNIYRIFDMFGRSYDTSSNLPAGIYIVNGEKVVIR